MKSIGLTDRDYPNARSELFQSRENDAEDVTSAREYLEIQQLAQETKFEATSIEFEKVISLTSSSPIMHRMLSLESTYAALETDGIEGRENNASNDVSGRVESACYNMLRTPLQQTSKIIDLREPESYKMGAQVSVNQINNKRLDMQNLRQLKEWLWNRPTAVQDDNKLPQEQEVHKQLLSVTSDQSELQATADSLLDLTSSERYQMYAIRSSSLTQIQRESMAVLLDAVRGSVLEDDEKLRFLFAALDVNKQDALSREGIEAFLEANMVLHGVKCQGQLEVAQIADKFFIKTAQPNAMTFDEFKAAFGHCVQESAQPSVYVTDKIHRIQQIKVSRVQNAAPIQRLSSLPQEGRKKWLSKQISGSSDGSKQLRHDKPTGKCHSIRMHAQNAIGLSRRGVDTRAEQPQFCKKTLRYRVTKWTKKYGPEIRFLIVYFGIMLFAFFMKYRTIAYDIAIHRAAKVAKGFAQIVMVNTLFVLFPICRNFITAVRQQSWLTRMVPVDHHISFHKLAGTVLLLAALGHSIAWLIIIHRLRSCPVDIWKQSSYSRLSFIRHESLQRLLLHLPIWTGILMSVLAIIASSMTHQRVRHSRLFNAFWFTHLLLVPFILLVLVHNLAQWVARPQAFVWISCPCILYIIEKRYRISHVFGGKTTIAYVRIYRDTVALYLRKPRSFGKSRGFEPGMYLYLNVPAISRFEWHPFTISSAPEDDFLSLHIMNAGDWTGALHALISGIQKKDESNFRFNSYGNHHMQMEDELGFSQYPLVYIDGPIGAPTQAFYQFNQLVFIGAGIGVTPFASILRTIVYQWESFRCPNCKHVHFPKSFHIQKIYFYWITREQESLSWFRDTMNQLSALDTENRLEIHNYFSPLKRESVIAPLRFVQTFIHNTEGQDIISGLETKQMTHFGRPNWAQEFERIAGEHQSQDGSASENGNDKEEKDIGVFFCGPRKMNALLRDECLHYNHLHARKSKIQFEYHAEIF